MLTGSLVGLAYGSLAIATFGCILFGLIHWDRQSSRTKGKKNDSGGSAAA